MQESGLKLKDTRNGAGSWYAIVTFIGLLQSYVLAHFVDFTNASTWLEGAQPGSWIWIGFVATAYTATYVFSKKSLKLWMIDAGYFLVVLMTQGALLAAWA